MAWKCRGPGGEDCGRKESPPRLYFVFGLQRDSLTAPLSPHFFQSPGAGARDTIEAMAFQWLQMRIGEERERRKREAATLAMLPEALADLNRQLAECIDAYASAFGEQSAEISFHSGKIRVTTRAEQNGRWEPTARMEIVAVETLPGFKVDAGSGEAMMIEVGLLPGDKPFFRHNDQYLTVEEMTRRILDRALFPKLKE